MGGIAAVYRRDGARIEPQLLDDLRRRLLVRGPDSSDVWSCGSFGLVHTHLATEPGSKADQPYSRDGQIWVTADARIDARRELAAKLGVHGEVSSISSDAELIWHAYRRWGERCAEHLLGDFAFVIADLNARRIVCARDHFGVKPLFYAVDKDWIVVSNLLECVRRFEFVESRLDEDFVLDFLLHGWNSRSTATAFEQVRRLAPAHTLVCTADNVRQSRYWELTVPPEDETTSHEEHVERFSERFEAAVSDRLRGQPAFLSFSGGKDSTSIAAEASRLLSDLPGQPSIRGICAVYDRIIPDQERRYATRAADWLGMPVDFLACDDLPVFDQDWDTPGGQTPEPSLRAEPVHRKLMEFTRGRTRFLLCGFGGDEALKAPSQYYWKLLQEGRWLRWAVDCGRHLWHLRSLPPVGLRTLLYKRAWGRLSGRQRLAPTFPAWLNPELVRAHHLQERWEQFWKEDRPLVDSRKPGGYAAFSRSLVAHSLDVYDAHSLGAGVEYRFPYLDLRVLQHLWSVPPIPLRFDKHIVQRAFDKRLPPEVLRRRKQPLAGEPLLAKRIHLPISWEECLDRTPELRSYVTCNPAPAGDFSKLNAYDLQAAIAVFELESWMHHRWRTLD
jgi:asparagine synthase (glutamine-hydrolysing)